MPSNPDSLLRAELLATGENATTWGIKTNNNIELLAEAVAGVANVNVGGSGNYTLVASNYVSDEARPATLVLTGTLTGNRDVIVPTSPKQYNVLNQTSGAFTLTIRQSAGTGVIVPQGVSQIVCTSTTCVDAIGATPYSKSLLDDSSAAAARTTLGATTTGDALFIATDATAARVILGATSTGSALFTAADAAAARSTLEVASVFVQRQTVSVAVGSVDFVLPAGFQAFEIAFDQVRLATDGSSLWLRGSTDGGATVLAGTQYANAAVYNNNTATAVGFTDAAVGRGLLSGGADNADSTVTVDGRFRFTVGSATRRAVFIGQSSVYDNLLSVPVAWNGTCWIAGGAAINAIRLLASSGNIASGTFTLTGIR